MHARFSSLLVAPLLAGWLAWQVPTCQAGEYRYPKLAPVLSVTLPDGWTVREQDGPAQLLLCSPPDDLTYTISLLSLPTVGGKEDLQAILTKITKAGATGAGMTDIALTPPLEGPVGKGVWQFTKITASGKHDGEDSAYTYYAFTLPATGKTYAVGTAGLQAMIDAHKAEFTAVAESITPVH